MSREALVEEILSLRKSNKLCQHYKEGENLELCASIQAQ